MEEDGQAAGDGEQGDRSHLGSQYTEKAALSLAAACISRQCVALRGSGRTYLKNSLLILSTGSALAPVAARLAAPEALAVSGLVLSGGLWSK
jgi:hypothetical protein